MPAACPGLRPLGIEAVHGAHQALPPQDLVTSGNAAGKPVGDIEDDAVAVGHHGIQRKDLIGYGAAADRAVNLLQQLDGGLSSTRSNAPATRHGSARHLALADANAERRDKVGHDVIIVSV